MIENEQVLQVLQFYAYNSPPDHALWKSVEWGLFRGYRDCPQPVLALGCGDGVFARLLFDRPLRSGIDIRRHRVRQAHRAHVYDIAVTGDATAMPYADHCFGTVFRACAMEHIPPLTKMLAEIERVLKPGGLLLSTVPSGYFCDCLYLPGLLRRLGLDLLASRYGTFVTRLLSICHLYHPARWAVLLRNAGLELVEARHFLPGAAISLFDRLLIIGNLLYPLMLLARGTSLHRRYVGWIVTRLQPYVGGPSRTGGALFLVARKPSGEWPG